MKTQMVATIAGAVILTILQALTGVIFGPLDVELPPNMAPWVLLSNGLQAAVLAWFARRAAWTGWRLAAALFAISYGAGQGNSLIEAYFFAIFPRPELLRDVFLQSLPPAAVFAPIMVLLTGRWSRAGTPPRRVPEWSAMGWLARFAACSVAYLVLYFTAGTIIFPYVREFYERLTLPSHTTVMLLQLLVRGPLFAAVALLIVRMAPALRAEHAVMVGVAMAILAGVAPLIVPNPFLPDQVRWVHFLEVVPSNLLFGWIAGWLLSGADEPLGTAVAPSRA